MYIGYLYIIHNTETKTFITSTSSAYPYRELPKTKTSALIHCLLVTPNRPCSMEIHLFFLRVSSVMDGR